MRVTICAFVFLWFVMTAACVLASGCAYNWDLQLTAYDPCVKADYVVDGLCVTELQGHTHLYPELVSKAIKATEDALARHHYYLDMPAFLAEHNIGVELAEIDAPGLGGEVCGYADDNQIRLEAPEPETQLGFYTALTHELLHTVAQFDMAVDFPTNYAHTQKYMFRVYTYEVNPTYLEAFTVEALAQQQITNDFKAFRRDLNSGWIEYPHP